MIIIIIMIIGIPINNTKQIVSQIIVIENISF